VVNVIRYHHERFDGKGYPSGLKGETIPVEARIVAIADTFDALISDRPYRKAMSIDQGYELLERLCDGQLDPILTELFLKLMKRRTSKQTLK
jgi:HD-GYP domain-containing protein (c-di-GMP phosphodiesterase class II)